MFEAVGEILKSLLPRDQWPAIDARLDVDLLVQELRNDACDFVALSEWLGTLLRRFVSPDRALLIDSMICKMHDGVRNKDIGEILDSFKRTFQILEVLTLVSLHHMPQQHTLSLTFYLLRIVQIQTFELYVPQWWTAQSSSSKRTSFDELKKVGTLVKRAPGS